MIAFRVVKFRWCCCFVALTVYCQVVHNLPRDCDNNHFGDDCSKRCGHCLKKDRPCDRTTGKCVLDSYQGGYCEAGYGGPTCTDKCMRGCYGIDCKQLCSRGCQNKECNSVTGYCTCRPEWKGNNAKCTKSCDNNHFGDDCSKRCGHCLKKDRPCDRTTGKCVLDSYQGGCCEAGYDGPTCTDKCKPGLYGIDCRQQCNLGCQNNECDSVTGHCSCHPGWKGSNSKCTKRSDENDSNDDGSVDKTTFIVVIVALFMMFMISVNIAIIWIRRRRRGSEPSPTSNGSDPNAASNGSDPNTAFIGSNPNQASIGSDPNQGLVDQDGYVIVLPLIPICYGNEGRHYMNAASTETGNKWKHYMNAV